MKKTLKKKKNPQFYSLHFSGFRLLNASADLGTMRSSFIYNLSQSHLFTKRTLYDDHTSFLPPIADNGEINF
jgi:hypothetical protein